MELDEILVQIVSESGLILFDCITSGAHAKVVVDTEEGISLDQITRLTRSIKKDPRIGELFPDGIRLEVSSPGIDSPMTRMFQYERNVGRRVRIFHGLEGIANPAEGKVTSAESGTVVIKNRKGEISFRLDDIDKGLLVTR